jgi:hypothetical protein
VVALWKASAIIQASTAGAFQMVMPVTVPRFNGEQFSVHKDKKWLVCFSSDLMPFRDWLQVQMQPTIAIKSNRLQDITLWNRLRNEGDGDETHVFIYGPSQRTLQAHPELQGWELHILND